MFWLTLLNIFLHHVSLCQNSYNAWLWCIRTLKDRTIFPRLSDRNIITMFWFSNDRFNYNYYLFQAVENVIAIGADNPINKGGPEMYLLSSQCSCMPPNGTSDPFVNQTWSAANWTNLDPMECINLNGTMVGVGCNMKKYVPDVFLMSVILFLGTFLLSVVLKDFKNSLFFPSSVSKSRHTCRKIYFGKRRCIKMFYILIRKL